MLYPDLKEIERKPRQYWNVDGLPDLMMGVLWIVWGMAFLLPDLLPPGGWLQYYWMAVMPVLVVGGVVANWAIKKLKQRLTFPRTGYVDWPEPAPASKVLASLLAAAVAAGVVLLAIRSNAQPMKDLVAPGLALLVALGFLISALRLKLPHYFWMAAAALLLALIIARAHLDLSKGIICLFLSLGVLSTLMGIVRLQAYRRNNPLQQEGEA
jgi:hypothetical protein